MKKLYRTSYDSKIAGICGGIGEYFGVDSNAIRILFLILLGCTFSGLMFVYLICIFIIPKKY